MKNYVKPDISFQKLNITTNISAGCEYSATSAAGDCPVDLPGQPGITVFQETTGCFAYAPGLQDTICYHVPTADANVFES